jgi:hypothetical protein
LPLEVTGYGVRSLFYTELPGRPRRSTIYDNNNKVDSRTTRRSTIYLIIIILFISLLGTLLLSPFVLVWLREGVEGVSEGGVNTRGRLGI